MQEFVEYVVRGLVDEPDAVEVAEVENGDSITYELRVAPDDVAKVIGRRGVTINAVRSLLQAGGAKKGQRCGLELLEDDD
jgi:predicted RNA-binding protein YlqC (UPF0109 family)|tara:strand:+ start:40 stop:279 length:240 start_codon:yes stop_codon:yes gene_type:complete